MLSAIFLIEVTAFTLNDHTNQAEVNADIGAMVRNIGKAEPGTCKFDTSISGSSNKAHDYGAELSNERKWQLVEYLKTL